MGRTRGGENDAAEEQPKNNAFSDRRSVGASFQSLYTQKITVRVFLATFFFPRKKGEGISHFFRSVGPSVGGPFCVCGHLGGVLTIPHLPSFLLLLLLILGGGEGREGEKGGRWGRWGKGRISDVRIEEDIWIKKCAFVVEKKVE